ncbi:MAG: precorrin-6A/cobalt-precorrin-6A reductase [Proteobacteria bacterium]|nr:precorrin-6A/cobalt-precorrin-6A reductase [Pseudomonadota bacterium]
MKILILGDTDDAEYLASKVSSTGNHKVIAAGALDHETAERLSDYFTRVGPDVVIDATHPFEASISQEAAKACRSLGLDHLLIVHPPWQAMKGDIWSEVRSLAAAADALTQGDHRVYLKVDPRYLPAFAESPPRIWFLIRRGKGAVPQLPLRNCGIVVDDRTPTVAGERKLIETYRITRLICANTGGEPGHAALLAAREMNVPVILVRPPAPPEGERAAGIEDALSWLARKVA